MVYKGLGEYQCEECGQMDYDDYGKVRNYLEHHRGANVAEISDATGVTHKSIRDMIKENRFEVVENRGGYLRCEMCGANINSGRLCPDYGTFGSVQKRHAIRHANSVYFRLFRRREDR